MSNLSDYKYIPKATGTSSVTASRAIVADSANAVAGANVSGQVGNALLAGTVYTNAQPNITSVGTLSNLVISGTSVTGVNSLLGGPTFTPLANTMGGFVSNVNSYTQLTIQNKNTGTDATTDFIATADNGSDTVNYLDMGIINSGYDALTPTNSLGNIVYAADSYIYAQGNASATNQSGGNLAIGTAVAGKTVKIFAGGVTASNVVATVANTGVTVTGNVTATKFVGDGSSLTNVTVSVAGNVIGTTSNVSLVAGSFTATFDNTGNLTVPGTVTATNGVLAVPAWTSAGAITIGATTTAPTKPTTRVQDNISYRQLGAKQWEVIMSWLVTSATGSVNGTGDYLFTLPNSLSFDTTLPSQQIYTGGVASSAWNTASYIIPSGSGLINNGTVGGQVYPLIYNGTTFRILTTSYSSAIQCWGAGYYGASCPGMQLTFRFTST